MYFETKNNHLYRVIGESSPGTGSRNVEVFSLLHSEGKETVYQAKGDKDKR